ncbi:MAG: nucleoside hydrolase [Caldilineaceae bacterium]
MILTPVQRIIIDTDPGIDDALAILLALASPEVQLEALTVVHGNCPLDQGGVNAIGILETAGTNTIPVAAGATLPLIRTPYTAEDVHGFTGLGYANLPATSRTTVKQHAVDLLIERLLAEPGEITVVAIGPLTNLALAIRREPQVTRSIRQLVIMGGSIRDGGNMSAAAEFNIFVDPHAAHIVFHAGIPTTLVPLDVTRRCRFTSEHIAQLSTINSPVARLIIDSTRYYIENNLKNGGDGSCALHDPLALAVAFAPDLVRTEERYVTVDLYSELSLGATIADFRLYSPHKPNMKVALDVDVDRFVQLFIQRLTDLAKS